VVNFEAGDLQRIPVVIIQVDNHVLLLLQVVVIIALRVLL